MMLGVALGDALGLPFEGLPARKIRPPFDRFRLVGRRGFVSDDTEQCALVAQALCPDHDVDAVRRRFRRSMVGWFARLPFGIGGATLRACVRMLLGLSRTGVDSAGNGAAMRAHPIAILDDPIRRRTLSDALASLTHSDGRALDAAWIVCEVSARALRCSDQTPAELLESLIPGLRGELREALTRGIRCTLEPERAGAELGNSGFVVHSVALCAWAFAGATTPMDAIERAIRAGGDTDTHASIVGGWAGARWGARALPPLTSQIHDGPFGPTHLDALTLALVRRNEPPRWSSLVALLRNLALYPVILAHGLRRLVPPRKLGTRN